MNNLIPEILKGIFKYLYDPNADSCYIADRNHLYSCLLVNRYWCKVSVPILWSRALNYYGNIHERQTKILSLLKCLDQKSRNNLINNGITFPFSFDEVTIFQYTSYIEVLDYGKLINLVEDWLNTLQKLPAESLSLVLRAILKMLVKETKIKSFKTWPLKYSTDLTHLILIEKDIENLYLDVKDLLIITNIRLDRWLEPLIKICRKIVSVYMNQSFFFFFSFFFKKKSVLIIHVEKVNNTNTRTNNFNSLTLYCRIHSNVFTYPTSTNTSKIKDF